MLMVRDEPIIYRQSLGPCSACGKGELRWNPTRRAHCCTGGRKGCQHGVVLGTLFDSPPHNDQFDRLMRGKPGEPDA